MKFLIPLLLLALGAQADETSDPRILILAQNQLSALLSALKNNQKNLFLKLVTTTQDDEKNYDKIREMLLKLELKGVSAEVNKDGNIEAYISVKDGPNAVMIMNQTLSSPTGWTVIAIGADIPTNQRHMKSWWSFCYIGIFWCAIELVARWSLGEIG